MSSNSGSSGIPGAFQALRRWYFNTPERALDAAYRAALKIRALENDYFDGQPVVADEARYTRLEWRQIKDERDRQLAEIERRLREFRASRSTLNAIAPKSMRPIDLSAIDEEKYRYSPDEKFQFSESLKKLKSIDKIAGKYLTGSVRSRVQPRPVPVASNGRNGKNGGTSASSNSPSATGQIPNDINVRSNRLSIDDPTVPSRSWRDRLNKPQNPRIETASDVESLSGQASLLPRSILRTVNRIREELDPNAEEDVVEKFRYYKSKTVISLKFMLLLILIPLLTHQVSKNFLIKPIYNEFFDEQVETFINPDFEEEAYRELNHYEERLKFRMAIGSAPDLTEETMEEKLQDKAVEIAEKFQKMSDNAVQNVFADLFSLGAFCGVILTGKQELEVVKSFIDDLIYGLSDSAKAFIIILFTDIFVGYHSPHGWEVILEGVSHHFGLPESRDFNFLFIATFPVILDTVMKYWIFRYLNRISPSAVATYRNMNE